MRSHFDYIRPRSLGEALDFMEQYRGQARPLAGGTDLLIDVRQGGVAEKYVVDISRLHELKTIKRKNGALFVGATATYTEIINSELVQEAAPVLALASRCVGSTQIRNVGTLGGNVANASPAADSVPALVVHKAQASILSASGTRTVPVENLITGPYRTDLKPGELITGFVLEPLKPGYRYSFQRVARRRALALARMNAAALGCTDAKGTICEVRLSVGSVTPRPMRMKAVEDHLKGKVPTMALFGEASHIVSKEMIRRSGVRSSTEYKQPAVEGLVMKALHEVFQIHMP